MVPPRPPHREAPSREHVLALLLAPLASSRNPEADSYGLPTVEEFDSSCPRIARRKMRVNAPMSRASTTSKPSNVKDVDGRDKPAMTAESVSIITRAGISS